jgi:hypothetical protein
VKDEFRCPSSPGVEGALIVGIVVGTGLAYPSREVRVTSEFLEAAGDRPTARFRFSLPCERDACRNFQDGGCGLIARFVDEAEAVPTASGQVDASLPRCAIRARCQWFRDAGRQACAVCPSVRHFTARPAIGPEADGGSDRAADT